MGNLVLFVHGLGADNNDWWGTTKDFFFHDEEIKANNYSIEFFLYATDKFTSYFGRAKNFFGLGERLASLDDLGGQLVSKIKTLLQLKNYDCIKLFGHSMGGLVISIALYKLKTGNNDEKLIYSKISNVAFCGTPIGGSKVAKLCKNIFALSSSSHTKSLSFGSEDIKKANNYLSDSISIVPSKEKPFLEFFKITDDEVVKEDNERFGSFLDKIGMEIKPISLTGGHCGAVKNLSKESVEYILIRDWILKTDNLSIEEDIPDYHHMSKKDIAINELKRYRYFLSEKNYQTLNEAEISFLKKNFIIRERNGVTTVLKNGCVIINAEIEIEIVKSGNFETEYIIATSFPENVIFPSFEEFLNSENRFNDFSFQAKILSYSRNGRKIPPDEHGNLKLKNESSNSKSLNILLTIPNCKENDIFFISYSVSIPKEYSLENIKLMKSDDGKYDSTFKMTTPIALKKITFQEEIYGKEFFDFRLKVDNDTSNEIFKYTNKYFVKDEDAFFPKVDYSIYYKKHYWEIYFYNIIDSVVSIKLT
ncbi:esterase/lipase family protein [Aliarcobacter butzleri]|uniref:esterase/lipase family protein n=1 Tax=Aliarcobacter butzleri TaxID=28197 RepID=UPI0021B25D2E|nr:alpha/beta hydrolase [Aliarcobacter butzleri]MCT7598998.1 alpha/beta hydrolase [Aliarcobacter butzleri]MCT7632167.1 alpha/beta hydrolase [Aliarcobacter butzleri]